MRYAANWSDSKHRSKKSKQQSNNRMKYNNTVSESKVGNTWSHLERTNKVTVHKCNNENSNF
jgi:hypothetical protein